MPDRNLPPPCSEEHSGFFVVRDNSGQAVASISFENDGRRRSTGKHLTEELRRTFLKMGYEFDLIIARQMMRVISFHSVPILFSHSLNDGRSTSSNSGQPEIGCGDSHGCFMVSGIISRILALLKTIVG